MEFTEVRDIFLTHLRDELIGTYPDLETAHSIEESGQLFEEHKTFLSAYLRSMEPVFPGEKKWELHLEFSRSLALNTNTTQTMAEEADQNMRDVVDPAINSDENYIILRDAGLIDARLIANADDQQNMSFNPHIFMCSTFD